MNFVWEILQESFADTWLVLPLLFVCYCLIEWFERRDSDDTPLFLGLQKYGPLVGALVGLIPQCGFSVVASMLYLQGNITLGTMIAVFAATSDEAVPVLLSNPDLLGTLVQVLVMKLVLASAVGYGVDLVFSRKKKIVHFSEEEEELEEDEEAAGCPCCYPDLPLWQSAALRSLKIFLWIFGVTVLFTGLAAGVGEDNLGRFLLHGSWFQPVLTALFGFIPNCAATVVLAELYSFGQLSYGAFFAGLVTNAGLGPLALVQYGARKKTIARVVLILFVAGVLSGIVLQLM